MLSPPWRFQMYTHIYISSFKDAPTSLIKNGIRFNLISPVHEKFIVTTFMSLSERTAVSSSLDNSDSLDSVEKYDFCTP